ncbi:MAG TPA: 50S ribosomal protein L15 [Candidatus Wildermuthbacteria bacterium]|nr:50S ribosomal protein L15 [Candidatus Wildermuthbacteria bacterium]
MQLHTIKSSRTTASRKRIGRGGKRGTYSGRGMKGQKSRAGAKYEPLIRQMVKRYPKLRGYRAQTRSYLQQIVSLSSLEKYLDDNAVITPKLLLKKNIISTMKGRMPKVKILGTGEVKKAFTIKGCEVSESAKAKIIAAGGSVEENK